MLVIPLSIIVIVFAVILVLKETIYAIMDIAGTHDKGEYVWVRREDVRGTGEGMRHITVDCQRTSIQSFRNNSGSKHAKRIQGKADASVPKTRGKLSMSRSGSKRQEGKKGARPNTCNAFAIRSKAQKNVEWKRHWMQ